MRVNNACDTYVLGRDVARGNRCIYSYREFLDSCCFQIAFRQRQTFLRESERERDETSLPLPPGGWTKTYARRKIHSSQERRRRLYVPICQPRDKSSLSLTLQKCSDYTFNNITESKQRVGARVVYNQFWCFYVLITRLFDKIKFYLTCKTFN